MNKPGYIIRATNLNQLDEYHNEVYRYLASPELLNDCNDYPFTPNMDSAHRYPTDRLGTMNAHFDLETCKNWLKERDEIVSSIEVIKCS